ASKGDPGLTHQGGDVEAGGIRARHGTAVRVVEAQCGVESVARAQQSVRIVALPGELVEVGRIPRCRVSLGDLKRQLSSILAGERHEEVVRRGAWTVLTSHLDDVRSPIPQHGTRFLQESRLIDVRPFAWAAGKE